MLMAFEWNLDVPPEKCVYKPCEGHVNHVKPCEGHMSRATVSLVKLHRLSKYLQQVLAACAHSAKTQQTHAPLRRNT